MEYQKIINVLDKTHEPSKFRTRHWIKINNESQGTLMIKLNLKIQIYKYMWLQWCGHTY